MEGCKGLLDGKGERDGVVYLCRWKPKEEVHRLQQVLFYAFFRSPPAPPTEVPKRVTPGKAYTHPKPGVSLLR